MKLMNNIDKEEKKLIRKMFWRSGAMYASVNPVTMGGAGFCYAMIPFINHFYKNDEQKRREALARHVWLLKYVSFSYSPSHLYKLQLSCQLLSFLFYIFSFLFLFTYIYCN